jgi:hypothetical protein
MAVNFNLLTLAEDQHLGARQLQASQVANELQRRAIAQQRADMTMLRGREQIAGAIGSLPEAFAGGYKMGKGIAADKRGPAYEEQVGDPNLPGSKGSIMQGVPSSRYNPGMSAPNMTPAVQSPPPDFDMTKNPGPNGASTDQDREFYEQLAMQYLRQQGHA